MNGRREAGAIRSLLNIRDLQLETCMKHCMYLFLCMTVTKCYKRRRRGLGLGIRGLLGIRRMDRVLNTWRRRLQIEGLMNVFYIGLAICRGWRMIGLLREYIGEYAGSRSVGRLGKR